MSLSMPRKPVWKVGFLVAGFGARVLLTAKAKQKKRIPKPITDPSHQPHLSAT